MAQQPWEQDWSKAGGGKVEDESTPPWERKWGAAPAAAKKPAADGQAVSGFKRSFQEVPGMLAGVGAFAADVVGADETRDSLLGYAKRKSDEVGAAHAGDAQSLTDAWDGKTSWGDFLANAAGYVAGQAIQSILTGGAGAIGARMLANNGIKQIGVKVAAEQIAAGATEEMAKAAAVKAMATAGEKAAVRGGIAGATAQNLNMELGSIYPEAVEQAGGVDKLDNGDRFRVLAASALAAGVDTAGEALTAFKWLKGSTAGGKGILGRAAREVPAGMAREAGTEAIQTGIEQWGADKALDVRDIVDSAGIGAVGGALAGGGASLRKREAEKPPEPKPDPVAAVLAAPDVDTAIKAAAESLTGAKKPAPAELPQMDAEDRREVLGLMQVVNRPGVSPNVARFAQARMDALLAPYRSIPTGEATEMLPVADARELSDEERAEYANAAPFSYRRAMERGLPQPEVTELIPAGDATEVEPIPAGDAFEEIPAPEAYETLPTGEVSDLIPTADATEFEAVPAGDTAELDVETIQPTDLMARDGQPFGSKTGAQAKAYASGGGKVVAIPNHFGSGIPGYVVRPLMQARPNNTRGTDARDLPRSSNDDQRDLAGSAEQVPGASDGRGADAARSGGAVGLVPAAPGRVDQPAEAPSTGNRPADVVAGAGDADTALTPGSRVTLNGTPYTVTTVNGSAVKLQGADGGTKMVAKGSKTYGQIQAEAPRREPGSATLKRPDADPAKRKRQQELIDRLNTYERDLVDRVENRGQQQDSAHNSALGMAGLTEDGLLQARGWAGLYPTMKPGVVVAYDGPLQDATGRRVDSKEPNEAARPQAQAAGAEGTAPAAAPAPAAPAVVPGAGGAAVQADGVKPAWGLTREQYFNDPARVRREAVGPTAGGWKASYEYTEPSGAGPFKGSAVVKDKPKAGDIISAPFGRARVTAVSAVKGAAIDNGELLELGKAHHKRVVADALAAGDPVPAEVLADYPDLKRPVATPNAEAPVQAAPRGAEAAPAVSAPSELPRLPVESYRVERRYANGAVIRPLPGKAFTDGEVQQIAGWFRAAKWEVSTAAPSGVSAVNNANMSADDIPEPYTAAQRKKDERQREADTATAAKTAAQDDYLTGTAAGKYVAATFGDALNKFNSVALAKFLAGDADTFAGLMNARAADVVQGMGIAVEGRATKDVLADLKARFAGQSAPAPERTPKAQAVKEALARKDKPLDALMEKLNGPEMSARPAFTAGRRVVRVVNLKQTNSALSIVADGDGFKVVVDNDMSGGLREKIAARLAEVAPAPVATHKDPGEPAEPAAAPTLPTPTLAERVKQRRGEKGAARDTLTATPLSGVELSSLAVASPPAPSRTARDGRMEQLDAEEMEAEEAREATIRRLTEQGVKPTRESVGQKRRPAEEGGGYVTQYQWRLKDGDDRYLELTDAERDRLLASPLARSTATHKDPGEPAEPVTPAVVREAIKTGVQATDRKPSAMKADLLQQIDDAVKEAPDYPDFEALVKQRGDKEAREFFTMRAGVGEKAAPEGYSRPKRTFRVEGDGVFTVNNTVRQLLTFRASVESSPGFKDRQAPAGLTEKATTALDRRSTDAAIANMVDEGDFQAALDFAEAKGVDIGAVKLTKLLRDRLEKWQRDTEMAAKVAEFQVRKPEDGPAPGSLAAIMAEAPAAKPEPEAKPADGIASQTFDQWVRAAYAANEYAPRYLEEFEGNENRAILGAAASTIDNERTTPDLLKAAKQVYRSKLFDLPREASIDLSVWDDLDNATKVEAQRHFFDLDSRITRRDQDTYAAKAKAEREKKAPYEAAFAEVDAEIRRLDKIPGPMTQKQKDLSARRDRLREAIYQIGQGKEPDGRLLRKEAAEPAPAPAPAAPAALSGPRRDPTLVSMFNPYINGDIVTIGGKDWMLKQDMPGWYLTSDGTWRGEHPTIKGIKAMMDLIREVEQAAQESAPAPTPTPAAQAPAGRDEQPPAEQAAAILNAAAEPPKGAERLSVIKDVKAGAITPEEVAAAFPPAGEVAAVEPVAEDAPVQAAAEPATKPDAAPTEPAPMPAVGGISMSLAQQAHSGTSFVPERRAEQERDSFRGALKDAWDRAARIAGTDPAAIARITEVFADVADGYRARYTATLQARSRVMSAMIAGPARFPVERNRKRMETERKRAEEASEFLARGIKRLIRAARGPIDNSPESELERVRLNLSQREELQETMKAANAALRKDDDAALEDLGFTAEQIADLKKGSKWDRGFPAYRLTNNNAEIRRLRERLQSAEERMAAAQAGPVEKERQGVKIVEDATDDRLRLIFDGKPSEAVREDLKANGFKWSPKNDAWQRQLTDNARYAAKQVLDKHYPADDAPAGGEARFSRRRMTQTERADNFSVWGGSAPVVDREQAGARGFKTGEPVVVEAYHGTARPDRVGTVFQTKRATSGPMAFFTSDPTLASSYAQGKEDTSIGEDYDGDYSQWFKVKTPGRRAQDVAGSWWSLTPEQRDRITNLAPRVVSREDDDGNTSIELADEGTTNGVGNYEYEYRKSRNPLRALVENWLASGMLFNEEQDFLKVLKAAGFPMDQVEYDSPRAKYPFVYKTFIRMGNPLVTSDIPQSTRDALEQAAKRDRSRPAAGGADQWDKNTRTLREWVAQLNDPERGSYAWTSIPDKVTDVFKSLGYDGIVDWSGKGGGNIVAPVYIPFAETQVKSALGNKGTFDPEKKDILYSRAPGRSVELEAADAVGREFWRKIDNGESFTDQEVLDALSINRRGSRRIARGMVAPADIAGVGIAPIEWQGDLASFGTYTSSASWDGDNFNVFFVPESLAQGADLSDYSQARDRALVHVSFRLADDGRYEISYNDPPAASTALLAAEKAGVAAKAGTAANEYRRIDLDAGDVQSREITQEAIRRLALNIGQTPAVFYPRRETGARAGQENTGRGWSKDYVREKFSRAPGSRTGVPMQDAEAVADAIRAAYPTGPQIVVLDDVRKAPEQLLDQIRAVQAANTVEGAYYKGKIYLFPQNVADIARLMFVGAHHEIRHAGLDALFGKRKGALLLSIAMSNPKVAEAARKKIADGVADSMVAATEEALADMPLEDMAKLNGWNKIVAAVRQWLRDMAARLKRNHPKLAAMIEPDQWTDNDVAALIRRAEDISRGGTVPARPGGAVFSDQESPDWYSALAEQTSKASMNAGPASAWKAMLKNWTATGKVKADEVEWSGLNEFLDLAGQAPAASSDGNATAAKNFSDAASAHAKLLADVIGGRARSVERNGLVKVPSDEAREYSGAVQRMAVDPDSAGNLRRFLASGGKGLRELDIPSARLVVNAVRVALHDLQVLNSVVKFVPVEVVNNFAGKQLSAKSLLNNPAVLKDFLAVNGDSAIPERIYRALEPVVSNPAFHVAEVLELALEVGGNLGGGSAAMVAGKGGHTSSVATTTSPGKITKAQVADYLRANGVQVTETVLSDAAAKALPPGWAVVDFGAGNADQRFVVYDEDENEVGAGDTEAEAIESAQDSDALSDTPNATKYGNYTLPGGTNYREVLLTLPTSKNAAQYKSGHWDQPNILAHIRVNDRMDADGTRVLFVEELQSDYAQDARKKGIQKKPETVESLDDPRVRLERRFEDGKELTDVYLDGENVQTWKGSIPADYILADLNEVIEKRAKKGVPAAPYIDATDKWVALAMKRVIKMAVDGGYDKVAFVTGEQSAERYDLSKQVEAINWIRRKDGTYDIAAFPVGGGQAINKNRLSSGEVADMIGKELADRITKEAGEPLPLDWADATGTLRGLDLKIGGEGMRAFYDKIVPAVAKDVLRKLGGGAMETVQIGRAELPWQVYDDEGDLRYETTTQQAAERWLDSQLGNSGTVRPAAIEQPGFTITQQMRDKALGGMPLFSRADQTQTPAFRRWFGSSKVVDAQGKPLVVYHGTDADFTEFKTRKQGSNTGAKDARMGFWFSSDAEHAGNFNASNVANRILPVYLGLKNPLVVDHSTLDASVAHPRGEKYESSLRTDAISKAKKAGHDGVIFKNTFDSYAARSDMSGAYRVDLYVAFHPAQIKSATGNRGTYDPASSDIRFSRAGTAKTTAQRQVTQAVRNTVADMLGNAGAKVSWWDKTLGTQYAKAQKFPAYKRVFDAVQQYLEDTSAMANEAADQAKGILPKLETWKDLKNFGLKPADAQAIAAPIFEGTLTDQKVYDDAELAGRFKLTPAQIAQYKEFRAAVNTSLDQAMAAEALRMLGDKNAALRELALTDRGALRAGVLQYLYQQAVKAGEDLDAQGDERGDFTKLRDDIAEKYDRIDSLKAQGYAPLMRFGQYKLNITDRATGQTLFFGLYESKAAANAALRDMQGDPTFEGADFEQGVLSQEQYKLFSAMPLDSLEMFAEAIGADQSEVFQDFIRLAKSNRSAMKRLLKRKGTAGFSEDVPRVLAAFVTSNARMAAGALNMPTAKEAAQDIRDGDVQDEAIKLLDVVQNPTDTAGAVRSTMFVNFIGGSIASAVVNLTQPLTMTLPYLSQFGGGVKAAKRLMAAGKMAASGRVDDLALRVALKRAETDGIVSPQEIHHLTAQAMGTFGTHPYLQRAAFIWAAPFSLAEQFNRRVSFIAAFETAREQGIEDPFGFAEKAVTETQGLYNKGNAPNLARGTIGAAALTFKQFSIHYLEWMGRMWNTGKPGSPERKAGRAAVGLALALLILAAGTDGLPFADDLDDLIDTLGQALGYDMNVKRARREFVAEQLGMGDAAADVMARGFSAVPGIPLDVSIRMSMGNLLPGTGMFLRSNTDKSRDLLEIAGPAGGLAKQYIEAGTKALKGDFGGAVQSALPVAFQNAFKGVDMWTTGEARDTLGRKVMDADEVDGLMKFIGFQPQAIARESEKIQMIRDSEQLAKNVEGEIASAWARAIVDKDPDGVADARAKLAQWNEDNPESPIRIKMQQIITRAKKLREDRASRFITSVSPERRRAVAEALE